jgi:hypothetical protein
MFLFSDKDRPGGISFRRFYRGEGSATQRKVLHTEARGCGDVLLHVATDEGAEVPRLGLGGCSG